MVRSSGSAYADSPDDPTPDQPSVVGASIPEAVPASMLRPSVSSLATTTLAPSPGEPVANEPGWQGRPSLAGGVDGYFAVWVDQGLEIRGQRLDRNGFRVGGHVTIGFGSSAQQVFSPKVEYGSGSNSYMVVWSRANGLRSVESYCVGFSCFTYTLDRRDVYVLPLAADGTPLRATPVLLTTEMTSFPFEETSFDIVYNSIQNEFLVDWTQPRGGLVSNGPFSYVAHPHHVAAQRLGPDGERRGPVVTLANPVVHLYQTVYSAQSDEYLVLADRDLRGTRGYEIDGYRSAASTLASRGSIWLTQGAEQEQLFAAASHDSTLNRYLVTWWDSSSPRRISGRIVQAGSGAMVTAPTLIMPAGVAYFPFSAYLPDEQQYVVVALGADDLLLRKVSADGVPIDAPVAVGSPGLPGRIGVRPPDGSGPPYLLIWEHDNDVFAGSGLAQSPGLPIFRSAYLTWKRPTDAHNNLSVEFALVASFKRSLLVGTGGDGHPVVGDFIAPAGLTLDFGDGVTLSPPEFLVLASNPADDWVYGQAVADRNHVRLPIVHEYPRLGPWLAEVTGCCRVDESVNGANTAYRVTDAISLQLETHPPETTLGHPGFQHCTQDDRCSFSNWDLDGDLVVARLATLDESGMEPPPGLAMEYTNGQGWHWDTRNLAAGLYSVQAVLESRDGWGTAVSKVSVELMIEVGPVFGNVTLVTAYGRLCDSAIVVRAGEEVALDFVVQNGLTTDAFGLPVGLEPVPRPPGFAPTYRLRWTPTLADIGVHVAGVVATGYGTSSCSLVLDVIADRDGDGLRDDWETNGYRLNGDSVDLPTMGANPDHKDIFLEIDYMKDHRPGDRAVDLMVGAFADAPNSLFKIPNPDGKDGIDVHITRSDEIPFEQQFGPAQVFYDWSRYDEVKRERFSPALALSHHYALVVGDSARMINADGTEGKVGGLARGIPSSDILISLVSLGPIVILDDSSMAAKLMHELGHSLGLSHGGGDENNCKPNYFSVMNYGFGGGVKKDGKVRLDYSRFELDPLDESGLIEYFGLSGASLVDGYETRWFCPAASGHCPDAWAETGPASGEKDWNCDDNVVRGPLQAVLRYKVAVDLNKDAPSADMTVLRGYNDWANLNFTGGVIGAMMPSRLPAVTQVDEPDRDAERRIPPFPPSDFAARPVSCALRLEWTALGDAQDWSYRVYRRQGDQSYQLNTSTTDSAVSVDVADRALSYDFYVTAVRSFGAESGPSTIAHVKGALERIEELKGMVRELETQLESCGRGFTQVLLTVLTQAADASVLGDYPRACKRLEAFGHKVHGLSHQLPNDDAAALIDAADQAGRVLCCERASGTP
jgi:hypothetical protein